MNKQESFVADGQWNRSKQLHCPSCGSTNFTASLESSIEGGKGSSVALTGWFVSNSFKFNNSHRNFWLCHNCGHKFRNLQNLKEEIAKKQAENKKTLLCAAFLLGIWIFMMILARDFSVIRNIFTVLIGAAELYAVTKFVLGKKKVDQMMEELYYLDLHCFR